MKEVKGRDLEPGMVLALPMGRTATIAETRPGRLYMNFRTEHGPTRVENDHPCMIETEE